MSEIDWSKVKPGDKLIGEFVVESISNTDVVKCSLPTSGLTGAIFLTQKWFTEHIPAPKRKASEAVAGDRLKLINAETSTYLVHEIIGDHVVLINEVSGRPCSERRDVANSWYEIVD